MALCARCGDKPALFPDPADPGGEPKLCRDCLGSRHRSELNRPQEAPKQKGRGFHKDTFD